MLAEPLMDLESLQNEDLFGTLHSMKIERSLNRKSSKELFEVYSVYAINQDLYILTNNFIEVYNWCSNKFKTSFDLKKYIPKNIWPPRFMGISTYLFIYNYGQSHIYKFDIQKAVCCKWGAKSAYLLSSTKQHTILAISSNHKDKYFSGNCKDISLLEFSLEGKPLKKIRLPESIPYLSIIIYGYQLDNGNYFCMSNKDGTVLISLLTSNEKVIKSFTKYYSKWIIACTDYAKYIYLLEFVTGFVTVLSIELDLIEEFQIPYAVDITYDRQNNGLLVTTKEQILDIKYKENILKEESF